MINVISTGIVGLDIALGQGGIPRGRLTEIFGPEKAGKTSLCLSIVSEVQKEGDAAAYVDIDQTLDASRASRLGIDIHKLIYARPGNALQALEITQTLTRSGELAVVVVDSVAGLLIMGAGSSVYTRGDAISRLLAQAVRKLSFITEQTGTAVLFTNELQEHAGVMYGVPTNTPGGISLKIHTSTRIEMIPCETIRSGMNIIGERVRVKVVKQKSKTPYHTTFVNIMYNGGISRLDNLFDLAVEQKYISKRGASFSYGELFLGHGRDGALTNLRSQPQLVEEIEATIRRHFPPSSVIV